MELINRILAKTAVSNARAILQDMTDRIEKKDPTHEIINRNRNLIEDLEDTRLFLMDSENEIRTLRNMLLVSEQTRLEQQKEIEKLNKKVTEFINFL